MPEAIINNSHLTFSEDTIVITKAMVESYLDVISHITIPMEVTTIASHAFFDCTGLTSVSLSEGLSSIGSAAFYDCARLTQLVFPDNLTIIGDSAFCGCTGLTHIALPNRLTAIGEHAFRFCAGLTQLNFPDSLTTIGNLAFADCSRLTHLIFPERLSSIGNWAFADCNELQYILIPQSLEHHDVAYWQDKGIDPARTKIITEAQLPQLPQFQAFLETKRIDSQTNTSEIATLFLADQGHVQLPQARDQLIIHQRITKLSLPNLFSLPILKNLILPGFATYQNLTETQAIIQAALTPLGRWAEQAASPLASWLSWHDIARIWLCKAQGPRQLCPPAIQAGQIYRHKDTAKRHNKGYIRSSILSRRPGHHPNHADPRTSCTKN